MPDTMTAEQRHKCMSQIRARDTKPEMIVRRWLWSEGWRYRLCVKGFPGKPDIVFRKLKTVVFVNGCFWHGHNVTVAGIDNENCGVVELTEQREQSQIDLDSVELRRKKDVIQLTDSDCCKIPHSNRDFWLKKITRNKTRDYQNYAAYHQAGWRVLVVWECMLKPKTREATLKALSLRLNSIFLESVRKPKPYKIEEQEKYLIAAEPEAEYGTEQNKQESFELTMRKFIITSEGDFRFGDVRMHKDLLQGFDVCKGGGFYQFDYASNRLLLTGRSYDFGNPQWDYIDVLRLPEALRGLSVLYEDRCLDVPIEYV